MAKLLEIFHRNRFRMRAVLEEFVVPPWEAESMLVAIVEAIPRREWEGVVNPDEILLSLLRQECLAFENRRRTGSKAPAWPSREELSRGRESACL